MAKINPDHIQSIVLSPITLFKNDNVYRICYGERRFRAAKQAGLKLISFKKSI